MVQGILSGVVEGLNKNKFNLERIKFFYLLLRYSGRVVHLAIAMKKICGFQGSTVIGILSQKRFSVTGIT